MPVKQTRKPVNAHNSYLKSLNLILCLLYVQHQQHHLDKNADNDIIITATGSILT